MDEIFDDSLDQVSAEKFQELIDTLKLTPIGMAAFLDISPDHVYSLRKGRRSISNQIAKDLELKLKLSLKDIFSPRNNITRSKINFTSLNDFRKENSDNINFFLDKKLENSLSSVIRIRLISTGYFDELKRVNEVVSKLKELGYETRSEKATKSLMYLVTTGYLKFDKKPIIKQNGEEGNRIVNYYRS